MTVTQIGEHFNVNSITVNNCFITLGWIEKINKWIIATEEGIKHGAEEQYNTKSKQKYVVWNSEIINNKKLITVIMNLPSQKEIKKEAIPLVKKTTDKGKIEKGMLYENFIALIYKANGFTIWEHGKEKGKEDGGIDLIVKKNKKIILIQCKNWNEAGRFKIDHKDIKVFRTEGRDFINKNEIFKSYELHLRYIISGDFMHPSAIYHIEECSKENKNVSYEIIKIPTVE